MKKSIDGVRVIREHDKDCPMLDPCNHVDIPLSMPGRQVYANSIGGPTRKVYLKFRWYVFECKSEACQAEVWIRCDIFARYAHKLMCEALAGREEGK